MADMVTPERVGERFLAVFHRLRRAADERMTASGLSLARAKLLRHTGKGAAALTTAAATREQLLNSLFGALDAAERQTLHDLLDRLDTALTSLSADDALAPAASGPAPASHVSEGTTSHVN